MSRGFLACLAFFIVMCCYAVGQIAKTSDVICWYGEKAWVNILNYNKMSVQEKECNYLNKGRLFRTFLCLGCDGRFSDLSEQKKRRILRMAKCVASAYAGASIPDGFKCQSSEWCRSAFSTSSVLEDFKCFDDGRVVLESGLSVRILRDVVSDELVVAFPGVEDINDVAVVLDAMLFGDDIGQLNESVEIVRTVSVAHNGKTVVAGHSLGGLLAAYATTAQKGNLYVECYLFNPMGAQYNLFRNLDFKRSKLIKRQIITVSHPQDIFGVPSLGMSYKLDWEFNVSVSKVHSIAHMISMMEILSGK